MYGKYKLEQSQEREIERWENEGGSPPGKTERTCDEASHCLKKIFERYRKVCQEPPSLFYILEDIGDFQEKDFSEISGRYGTLPPIQGIFTGRKEDSDFQNAIEAFRKKQPYFKARIYEVNGSDGTGSKATGGGDGDRSSQASEQEGTGTKRKCNPDEDV